jgi:hypothetical protein
MSEDPSTLSDELRRLKSETDTLSVDAWRTVADLKAASPREPETDPPQKATAERSERSQHGRGGGLVGWFLFAVFVVYPLSIMPAYVVMLLLRSRGIDLYEPYASFYWPIIWVLRNVEWARRLDDTIEPLLRGLVR